MSASPDDAQIVVAALIERGGHLLISQRRPDAGHGGRWEFPGGKRESGEDDACALGRELREELGIDLEVGPRAWTERSGPLELRFFWCPWAPAQRPRALEVAQFRWVRIGDLDGYAFPPADARLVRALVDGRLCRSPHGVSTCGVESKAETGGLHGEGKARASQQFPDDVR